jgi:ABC-2 type transport system permease protein
MRAVRIVLLLAVKNLRLISRSRGTILVIFLPGIVLYAIFASIFSGAAGRPFRVAVIDEDRSEASATLIAELERNKVRVVRSEDERPDGPPLTAESAIESIRRRGKFRVALVIPQGYSKSPSYLTDPARHHGVRLYFDQKEPVEADIVIGMVQMAAGRAYFETMLGLKARPATQADESPRLLVKVDRQDVATSRPKIAAKHTFLAGLVPMFLLFVSAGAARALLQAIGSGEMRRLMAAPIEASHVLGAEMVSSLVVSLLQCAAMYLFAWLVYDVDIWAVVGGLALLTIATCLATTSFGLLLGALCHRAEQLDAVGTMAILAMSAVGGSMVPRWIMPDFMLKLGLLTINGWAYDGFMDVISNRGAGVVAGECAVLVGIAGVCFVLGTRLLSRRLRGNMVS